MAKKIPSQIIVTEASAGSGKTYALAKRYIQLLLKPEMTPDEIPFKSTLAITFTNAATLEMKSRILEFLKRIALMQFRKPEDETDILSSLTIDSSAAKKNSSLLLEFLFRNYNFFAVQTIDSFIKSLLTGCSLPLGLSSHFEIEDNTDQYIAYSFDTLIDKAAGDKKIMKLFMGFIDHYLEIENKTKWDPKITILENIKKLFDKTNTYGKRPAKTRTSKLTTLQCKDEVLALLKDLYEAVNKTDAIDAVKKNLSDHLKWLFEDPEGVLDFSDLPACFKDNELPCLKGKADDVPAAVHKLWKNVTSKITEYVEIYSYELYNPYIDIYDQVIGELKEIEEKEGILFLEQLNFRATSLSDLIEVPERYLRLATKFRNYLIDEFQDTSRLQWNNLYPMIEEAVASGGSLFYVGDKKQAIYRFRGGDVSLFDDVKEATFKDFDPDVRVLKQNYRSQKEIVEWNNRIFSQENLSSFLDEVYAKKKASKDKIEITGKDDILKHFKDAHQEHQKGKEHGYVSIQLIAGEDKDESYELTKEKLLALLSELKTRFNDGEIAILTRDNDEVAAVTEWLLEKNLRVESEKTLSIKENPVIKELVSFISFLLSPIDNLSFASFILGNVFLKAASVDKKLIESFLFAQRHIRSKKKYIYRAFRKELPSAWSSLIDPFFKSVGFVPMYEFIVSIMEKFDIPKNFPQHQPFLMKFLELVQKKEKDESSMDAFMDFFESLDDNEFYVHVSRSDAIKVETVHKTKGLDFGVVILPFLGIEVKTDNPLIEAGEKSLALIRIRPEFCKYSDDLEQLYIREYKRSLVDELNKTYVALTRAKYELYVFVPAKIGKSSNLALSLIPQEMYERGIKIKCEEKKEEISVPLLPVSSYKSWLPLMKGEFIEESRIYNRENLLRGDALHAMFSFVGNLKEQEKEAVIEMAVKRTRCLYPDADIAEAEAVFRKTLDDEKLKLFFYVDKGGVFQEKEFITTTGKTERMDRLVVTANEVRILDYKSSRDSAESHVRQVRDYMEIMKELFPDKDVRGFLLYLDEISLEEVPWNA